MLREGPVLELVYKLIHLPRESPQIQRDALSIVGNSSGLIGAQGHVRDSGLRFV
jgi:hypothetical protein